MGKITILIPCHNEERGASKCWTIFLITHYEKHGFESKVIVKESVGKKNIDLLKTVDEREMEK